MSQRNKPQRDRRTSVGIDRGKKRHLKAPCAAEAYYQIEPVATATLAESVPRRLNAPQNEATGYVMPREG